MTRTWRLGLFNGLCLLVVTCVSVTSPSTATAQQGETTLTGKVVSLTENRRSKVLVVDVDGEEQEFQITPKIDLQILASGDEGFLARKQLVQTMAVASNNKLFTQNVRITVNPKGRLPAATAVKAPPRPGQSMNAYLVAGVIASRETTETGYELLQLTIKGNATLPLYVEKGFKVTVNLSDVSMVEAGQEVTLTGRTAGRRFLLSAATINTGKTVSSADLLSAGEK